MVLTIIKNPKAPVFGPHLHQFLILEAEVWDKTGAAVNEVDLFVSSPELPNAESESTHKRMQRTKATRVWTVIDTNANLKYNFKSLISSRMRMPTGGVM